MGRSLVGLAIAGAVLIALLHELPTLLAFPTTTSAPSPAASGPVATVTPTTILVIIATSPTPTAAPTPVRPIPAFAKPRDEAAEDVLGLLLAGAKLMLIPLLLVAIVAAVLWLWTLEQGIVFDDFLDGTGETSLSGAMPGLTERSKKHVADHADWLRRNAARNIRNARRSLDPRSADQIADLLKTYKDVLPTYLQAFLLLLQALLPPLNTRVAARIVSVGGRAGDMSVIVRVDHASGPSGSPHTVAEPGTASPPPVDPRRRADDVLREAMRWVAIELWERAALKEVK